jgi:hypothetical protein
MLNQKAQIWISCGLVGSVLLIGFTANATYHHVQQETGWVKPADLGLKAYAFGRCYPSTYQEPVNIQKAQDSKTTYWEVQASALDPAQSSVQTLHFVTEDAKCSWLNRNREPVRLTYMPETVAITLSKQEFELTLASCRKANPQMKDPTAFCLKDLPRALSGTLQQPEILYAEDVKTLTAMGINPKKIENVRLMRSSADVQ